MKTPSQKQIQLAIVHAEEEAINRIFEHVSALPIELVTFVCIRQLIKRINCLKN